jgi:hypothetical protein
MTHLPRDGKQMALVAGLNGHAVSHQVPGTGAVKGLVRRTLDGSAEGSGGRGPRRAACCGAGGSGRTRLAPGTLVG